MSKTPGDKWPTDITLTLLDLRARGCTFSQIADRLGMTTSQVESKYRRLKAAGAVPNFTSGLAQIEPYNDTPHQVTTTASTHGCGTSWTWWHGDASCNIHGCTQCNRPEGESNSDDELDLGINWDMGELTGSRLGKPFTLDDLMSAAGLREDEWRQVWVIPNSWTTTMKNGSGESVQVRNYHLKAKFEPIQEVIDARAIQEQLIQEIRDEIKTLRPTGIRIPSNFDVEHDPQGVMVEIDLMDVHMAMLAWGAETGEDQDLKIAEARVKAAVEHFLKRLKDLKVARFCLPIGNDFFHIDTLIAGKGGATTAGTPQDVDSRWQKGFLIGRRLMTDIIETLICIAPVDVIITPGNHDQAKAWYLGEVLSARFHGEPRVRIDNRPTLRKYYRYGKNLIMFVHGDKENVRDLPGIMAQEARQDWGDTLYREIHMGHLHKEFTDEKLGVRTRIMPSLASADAWHKDKGYVHNIKGARCYVWTLYQGIDAVFHYNLPITLSSVSKMGPVLRGDSTKVVSEPSE